MRTPTLDVGAQARPATAAAQRARALTPSEIAWIAAIPTAVITLIAIAVLGPPLGSALFPEGRYVPFPTAEVSFAPEPHEHGRFLVSLIAPLLLSALTILGVRAKPRLTPAATTALVVGAQVAGAVFVVVCIAEQWRFLFGQRYTDDPFTSIHRAYFSPATYVVAALVAVGLVAIWRNASARARVLAWTRDTTAARISGAALAVAATFVWLLHAFNTEGSIGAADGAVAFHIQFTLNETFTVLNGGGPLIDFAAQYGSLWPYPIAAAMSLVGPSVGAFSALTLTITGVGMIAIYGVLRRIVRSALLGLLLFLPFLATSFFVVHGALENRYTFATLSGSFPMRYAGPFMLAWLLARHLDGARPRRLWLLFLAAGLVVLNNFDAGVPALGATVAALLWAGGRPTRASLGRLALGIAAGLLIAFALVSLLTLLRSGTLPHLELLTRYSRLFAAAGFGMLPMPTLGLHIVIYLTFVAAIGVATVRAVRGAPDRLLTGMLAFIGAFGLGAGAYYVGRSHPESLVAMFSNWSLALALLTVVALRAIAARPSGIPSLAELSCLLGFGVAVCSLAQTPLPWQQLDRIATTTQPTYFDPPAGQALVEPTARRGEAVLIMFQLGHRIAHNVGVTNVAPYTGSLSMPLREQFDEALDRLQEAGGRKVYLPLGEGPAPDLQQELSRRGFELRLRDDVNGHEFWALPAR